MINDSLLVPTNIDGKLEQLKEYEIPKDFEFVTELPRISGTEKIDYTTLEQDALQKKEKGLCRVKK